MSRYCDDVHGKLFTRCRSNDCVIIDKFNIGIKTHDLRRLTGDRWLNDNLINFLIGMLDERNSKKLVTSLHYFNTFFATEIVRDLNNFTKFTRHVDIFSKKVLFIPIHVGTHWILAVVYMEDMKMVLYDSLEPSINKFKVIVERMLDVLTLVAAANKNSSFNRSLWSCEVADCPKQDNGHDCGVFCIVFMILLTDQVDLNLIRSADMVFLRHRLFNDIRRGSFRF